MGGLSPRRVDSAILEGQRVVHAVQARALNRQDHDELDVARCAGDLDREAVLDVSQQPHVAVVQIPSANGAVGGYNAEALKEIEQLRAELKRAEQERDILKKSHIEFLLAELAPRELSLLT